jgi:hypothetical protein
MQCKFLMSFFADSITILDEAPELMYPHTSNWSFRMDFIRAAQPRKWLSPTISTLCLRGLVNSFFFY